MWKVESLNWKRFRDVNIESVFIAIIIWDHRCHRNAKLNAYSDICCRCRSNSFIRLPNVHKCAIKKRWCVNSNETKKKQQPHIIVNNFLIGLLFFRFYSSHSLNVSMCLNVIFSSFVRIWIERRRKNWIHVNSAKERLKWIKINELKCEIYVGVAHE